MKQSPTIRQNTRHRVFQELRSRIVSLNLPPGSPISENELSTRLGVSRTPIREAILLLAEEGLVEVFPKKGTFVTRLDQEQVREAQFLREAVEIASLRSITFPLDDEKVAALRANLEEQSQVEPGDLTRFFSLDEQLHQGLMDLQGHGTSWNVVAAAKGHLDRARVLGIREVSNPQHLYDEHRGVVEAVIAEDLDTAEDLLRAHLRLVFTEILEAEEHRAQKKGRNEQHREGRDPHHRGGSKLRYPASHHR